jgi:hypothetical protein
MKYPFKKVIIRVSALLFVWFLYLKHKDPWVYLIYFYILYAEVKFHKQEEALDTERFKTEHWRDKALDYLEMYKKHGVKKTKQ